MKKFTLFLLWITIAAGASAQKLTPTVIPATGGYSTAGNVKLSWTMGETYTPTLRAGSNILTQGFEQPEVDIKTGTIANNPICTGTPFSVPYTAIDVINAANIFTAQLSDSTGSFASPLAIGSVIGLNSGTISATIPYTIPNGTRYRIRVISSTTVKGSDNGVNLTISNCGLTVWTGNTSTNWFTATNWTAGLPGCNLLDALILPSSQNPVISTSTASVRNMTISSGATLTINSTLDVCGRWTDNGTASVGNGNVVLQSTGDSILGYTSFGNLEIAGTYTVAATANSKADVRGILKKTSGNLNTTDKITLKSTATQTALIQENGGVLTGRITMERYEAGAAGPHQLSSPMTDAAVSQWADNFTISGASGTGSFIHGAEGTLEEYRESANATNNLDSGYYNYTLLTLPLSSTKGFSASLTGTTNLINTFGTPLATTVSTTITHTAGGGSARGWNFIGNPYPSPISWAALKGIDSGLMNGTCYIWKATGTTTGNWQSYNGTSGTNGLGNVIASHQGFFILTTIASANINFSNSIRTIDLSPVFYKTYPAQDNEVRINLANNSNNESDEAVGYTEGGASDGFDIWTDGLKPILPQGVQSSSIAYYIKDTAYSIHVTDKVVENTVWPLTIHLADAGNYQVSASAINVVGLPVYLLDNYENTYYDLNAEAATISTMGNEDITGRYSVVFHKKDNGKTPDQNNINIYGKSGAIVVERSNGLEPAAVKVTNLLGQEVVTTTIEGTRLEIPMTQVDAAIYLVYVKESDRDYVSKKVFVLNYK